MSQPKSQQVENFEHVYESWKVAIVCVRVLSVSIKVNEEWVLLSARVDLFPKMSGVVRELVETSSLRIGTEQFSVTSEELDEFMVGAREGQISMPGCELTLPQEHSLSEYAPQPFVLNGYVMPQLELRGDRPDSIVQALNHERTNSELRAADVPFNGLGDVISYFGFGVHGHLPNEAKLLVNLHPPCDVMLGQWGLTQNKLSVTIRRKVEFDATELRVGLRLFPDPLMRRRLQVGQHISWNRRDDGFEDGVLEVQLEECAWVELMLTAGGNSVRQVLIEDPQKGLNSRLLDYRVYDPDLTYLNKGLRVTKGDARNLEAAMGALLHLFGASAITPPFSDTPDVLAETLGKRIAVVECTTAINNLHDKVGKLAGRRDALLQHHAKIGGYREVMAVLVVNVEVSLTAGDARYLIEQQVALVTIKEIESALRVVHLPQNLDDIFVAKAEELRMQLSGLLGQQGAIAWQE